jgi:hypothetical protein
MEEDQEAVEAQKEVIPNAYPGIPDHLLLGRGEMHVCEVTHGQYVAATNLYGGTFFQYDKAGKYYLKGSKKDIDSLRRIRPN